MNKHSCFRALVWLGLAVATPLIVGAQGIDRQDETIQSSRRDSTGQPVAVNVIYESSTNAPKAVLLIMPSLAAPTKNAAASTRELHPHEPEHYPLSRNRESLLQSGLALAWMGWPSQSEFGISGTAHPDMQKDIASVIEHARKRWPKAPLVLTGTDGGAHTALAYALERSGTVNAMLALSPHWLRERSENVESLKRLKTLVLHDSSGECMGFAAPEVEEIARRAGFTRIPVHQSSVGQMGRCSAKSAQWLPQADGQLAPLLTKWLDNQALPAHLGANDPVFVLTERVIFGQSDAGSMEITIFTPPGKGPFPLLIFNHGDVEMDQSYIKMKERFREPIVAAAFLKLGFAVAVPARPGVGRSEGTYRYGQYALGDGDPNYKARQHSAAVLAALERLSREPDLNLKQVLLAGQSAGGDTVMYMSTLALPGVRGIVNFSGGRTNHRAGENPNFENKMMIEGWAELGRSAKEPVLLIFAENDSRFTPNTIRKSAQAFRDAGGQAELLLLPPIAGDGHFVYYSPALWGAALGQYVAARNMGNQALGPLAHMAEKGTQKTHPELFDLSRLPTKGAGCKDLFLRFLNLSLPRFFSAGASGRGCGYSYGPEAAEGKAVALCQQYGTQCILYARDNELVKPLYAADPPVAAKPSTEPL